MRGARQAIKRSLQVARIIPAYAGSTSLLVRLRTVYRDHPRVCGEHIFVCLEYSAAKGSSPRMRGARQATYGYSLKLGIIPAYAGSTCQRDKPMRLAWDHPRVCGEHTKKSQFRIPQSYN